MLIQSFMKNESLIATNPLLNKKPLRWKALLRISALSSSAIEGIHPLAKDLRKVSLKFSFLKHRTRIAA